jgi:hypothetical protein
MSDRPTLLSRLVEAETLPIPCVEIYEEDRVPAHAVEVWYKGADGFIAWMVTERPPTRYEVSSELWGSTCGLGQPRFCIRAPLEEARQP